MWYLIQAGTVCLWPFVQVSSKNGLMSIGGIFMLFISPFGAFCQGGILIGTIAEK